MSFIAVTLPALVTVGGTAIRARGNRRAVDASVAGDQAAIDEARRQYDLTREDFAPWRAGGVDALNQLQDPGQYFETSPGYQFRLDEGTRNLENRFSVGGGGGNAMRALAEFGQGFASNEYGNWWNQQAGRAGLGLSATTAGAGIGTSLSKDISGRYSSQGNTRASGLDYRSGLWSNAFQQVGSNYLDYKAGPR